MILLLLQTVAFSNPSQTLTSPLVGLTLLFLSLIISIVLFVRNEYRRSKRKNKKNQIRNANTIVMERKHDTEEAVIPSIAIHLDDLPHADRSHIGLSHKEKSEESSPYPSTAKKQVKHINIGESGMRTWNIQRESNSDHMRETKPQYNFEHLNLSPRRLD
jgi:hypothetical protein